MKKVSISLIAGMLSFPAIVSAQFQLSPQYNNTSVQYQGKEAGVANAYWVGTKLEKERVDYINGDFGTVKQGENITTFFVIPQGKYVDNTDMNVNKVYADRKSGVTHASAIKDQSIIEVGFDSSGKSGKIDETVTVYTDRGTYYLKLTGRVDQ